MKRNIRYAIQAVFLLTFLTGCAAGPDPNILPWEEYRKNVHTEPYVLEVNSQEGSLLYYGGFHTFNEDHPQLSDIERQWQIFQPTLALCEGNIWPLEKSRSRAIGQYGEQGLLRFLADRDKVKIRCIEPPRIKEINLLLQTFQPERITLFYILRQSLVNRILFKKDHQDVRYAKKMLAAYSKFLKAGPKNLNGFEYAVKRLFPDLPDWRKIPEHYFYSDNWLGNMHALTTDYRNREMASEIIQAMKNGERIFALVGCSHVISQEPALLSLIKTNSK